MRIFASDRIRGIMQSLGLEKGEAIEHRMVTNAIEKAQRKVEGRNFDIRKNLLEYDDVSNDQRQVIYQQRDELMAADEIADMIRESARRNRRERHRRVHPGAEPRGTMGHRGAGSRRC